MKKKGIDWILGMMLCVGLILVMAGCGASSRRVKQKTALDSNVENSKMTAVAIVMAVDDEEKTVSLKDTETSEIETFPYNGATTVYSRNKVAMVMNQVSCGEIVEATYGGSNRMLKKVQISKEAWQYTGVVGEQLNRTESTITVTGRTYDYEQDVTVFRGKESLMMMDLNERDLLTIKGIGTKVYSFIIDRGHGFIRLLGQDAFLGGTIEVDQNIFMEVKDNMLFTVGEGEHTVLLRNNEDEYVQTVSVEQNKETFLDVSEYKPVGEGIGKVKFSINPKNAVLTINGTVRRANSVLSLSYGNYNVAVKAEGYKDYTGILRVQKSSSDYETIYVDLVEEKKKESTATTTPSATEQVVGTPQASVTATPDAEHTITINTPEGASVYANGEYQGVVPVTFKKVPGSMTITLSREGYETKSYTVEVDSGERDVNYSFADLTLKS